MTFRKIEHNEPLTKAEEKTKVIKFYESMVLSLAKTDEQKKIAKEIMIPGFTNFLEKWPKKFSKCVKLHVYLDDSKQETTVYIRCKTDNNAKNGFKYIGGKKWMNYIKAAAEKMLPQNQKFWADNPGNASLSTVEMQQKVTAGFEHLNRVNEKPDFAQIGKKAFPNNNEDAKLLAINLKILYSLQTYNALIRLFGALLTPDPNACYINPKLLITPRDCQIRSQTTTTPHNVISCAKNPQILCMPKVPQSKTPLPVEPLSEVESVGTITLSDMESISNFDSEPENDTTQNDTLSNVADDDDDDNDVDDDDDNNDDNGDDSDDDNESKNVYSMKDSVFTTEIYQSP